MQNRKFDIAVIGGGASGMTAAITAARAGCRVVVLEAGPRVGRKLLATGNGRCNLSHAGFTLANYHGSHPHFAASALERFDEASTLAWWRDLGLEIVTDDRDRYYPASLQAQAVLDLLRLGLDEAGATVVTDARVTGLTHDGLTFRLHCGSAIYAASAVIMAAGGQASPKLGGCRDGCDLMKTLGHAVVVARPGIVQLECRMETLAAAAGLKRQALVSFYNKEGKRLVQGQGELLLTKYGLSGPAALEPSAAVVRALEAGPVTARINFFPEKSAQALTDAFAARLKAHPDRTGDQFFLGLLPRMLGHCALRACGLDGRQPLTAKQARHLARILAAWPLTVTGPRGFDNAQVTLGGLDCADFDPKSLASWIVPGLFACGEVLDVDGDCGGYNLQWAWSSGRLAGQSAAAWVCQ